MLIEETRDLRVPHGLLKYRDQIFQIDIAARSLVRTIDIAPFNRLHGMQIDDQDRLYALSEDRAQLVVIDGAGHLSNIEQPDAFNRALGAFLDHVD